MAQGETELEMVQRHVYQGHARVARQHRIIAKLRADNRPTQLAEETLLALQDIQPEGIL